MIDDILKVEENSRIEVLIHDKFKFPELYTFDELSLNASNNLMDQLAEDKDTRISKVDLEWLMEVETTILANIDNYLFLEKSRCLNN